MDYGIRMIDLMKEIGCGDGFHIPVANEENKLLEKQVRVIIYLYYVYFKLKQISIGYYKIVKTIYSKIYRI